MRITQSKVKEFMKMSIDRKRVMLDDFQLSHKTFNNQYSIELKSISEYNFWIGYEYAMLKILQYMKYSPDESNPHIIS